ncbi:MAG: hypothetical protein IT356_07135 [Gemmatimonadaceae bacterium]|nr:hypothetical protein [Gemmatimonadaceae bacterium]
MHTARIARTLLLAATVLTPGATLAAQQMVTETRDPKQQQDPEFARLYAQWTGDAKYGSPLVDHLPKVAGIPTPKDVLGYYIGAPRKLTYYADILRYYRALEKASPRVKVETIGRSDEGRELVVVWISSEANIANLARNRANMAKLADPRGLSDAQVKALIEDTKPQYHLMGGLHSGETGPSEMLMELAYRLVAETSPLLTQIRNNVYVSITPAAEPDGRDRNVDWFYYGLDAAAKAVEAGTVPAPAAAGTGFGGGRGGGLVGSVPYWGKYVSHDNNRDINLSQMSMRAITDWYFTAHPPIMHDLHESMTLMYTYSGGPPQNPNLDPILFAELPFFSNWEMAQMTKWGMPGVYTHAFMDGWSPGYLGSVAYNHNGLMKMYETQSGVDIAVTAADSAIVAALTGRGGAPGGGGAAAPGGGRGGAAGAAAAGGAGGRGAGAAAGGRGAGPGGGRGGAAAAGAPGAGRGGAAPPEFMGRGGPAVPTGRGGGQPREWYRGLPVPPNAVQNFTRRDNTNYMQTGVLSALQLTSMFPNLVLENFYVKTRNSMNEGRAKAPYAYVFPVQREMTKVATLVNVLRAQGIEVGTLNAAVTVDSVTFPAGSYLVKLDQPYGRLARNLLEKQDYPDPALTTYDDSGWSMEFAFNVDMKPVNNTTILAAAVTPVKTAVVHGTVAGSGTTMAVAHLGSNNMISLRYRLKNVPMKVAEQPFTSGGVTFPAGSFVFTGSAADLQAARAAVDSLGLTAALLPSAPSVPTHDADVPRIALYSQWSGTQELGWYRHAFDQFAIPYDLVFKERIQKGNLKADYDVIVMAAQNVNRNAVLAPPAARPQPYQKSDKYKVLGAYGETSDMSGGFGEAGVAAIEKFLDDGGTLITTLNAVSFPIEFGLARSVSTEAPQGVTAQKPLVEAQVNRPDHPVFYGFDKKTFPVKFGQGQQVFRVGVADQQNVLASFVGGDSAVLSGLMTGADNIAGRAFAMDIPSAHNGKGRVLMFANNPVYRWQNHGEFNLLFNSIVNWNDVPAPTASQRPTP